MGGRYYITGVQLGILKAELEELPNASISSISLVNEIMNNQYIGKARDLKRKKKKGE